jgi:hypothetical protein
MKLESLRLSPAGSPVEVRAARGTAKGQGPARREHANDHESASSCILFVHSSLAPERDAGLAARSARQARFGSGAGEISQKGREDLVDSEASALIRLLLDLDLTEDVPRQCRTIAVSGLLRAGGSSCALLA